MLPPLAKMSNDVVPQASISKPRFLPRESLKRDSYLKPQFGSDPAKKLFKHMHRMSMKAQARVKDGRVSKTAIVEVSESSSAMTVSSLSDKVKPPVTRKGLIVGDEEEKRVVPPYLLDEDVSGAFERRNLKAYTQSLVDRSREINNQGRITAIFKYNQRIIYTLKPVNYSATPASALKVQWRISRSLLTPSFIMVFSMLNRYGTVVALIKRSSNSAMCIFETVDQAQRAINMHSLNQSSKILILSWWHQMLGSRMIHEGTTTTQGISRWLETMCEALLKSDEQSNELREGHKLRPSSLHSAASRRSTVSQRHKSSIMGDLKRALTKYSEYATAPDDSASTVGTLPMI
ncbi:hypothetical protein BsWGS_26567 [Bradybaena similaris]